MIDREALERAAQALDGATTMILACHVGPDGDALGSMLALGSAARDAGRKVWCTFGSPFEVSESFRYLPVDMLVPPDELPDDADLLVAFDTGSPDRLGEVGSHIKKVSSTIVIDHHVTNEGFGEVALVDPAVSSTAELTLAVIRRLGWPITPVIATCLLTGIVTDTGRFQYSNTGPRTLEAAARLVAAGARPEVIGRHMYEEEAFGYLAVASAVTGRAVLESDRALVWSVVFPDDLAAAGVDRGDIDGLIDLIRLPRDAEVAALVKVIDEKTVKVSLRSRGKVDVGSIAADMGGGGHHNASGFTFDGGPDDALAAVRERLPDA